MYCRETRRTVYKCAEVGLGRTVRLLPRVAGMWTGALLCSQAANSIMIGLCIKQVYNHQAMVHSHSAYAHGRDVHSILNVQT